MVKFGISFKIAFFIDFPFISVSCLKDFCFSMLYELSLMKYLLQIFSLKIYIHMFKNFTTKK